MISVPVVRRSNIRTYVVDERVNGGEAKATDRELRDASLRDCLQERAETLLSVTKPSECLHRLSNVDSISRARARAADSVV